MEYSIGQSIAILMLFILAIVGVFTGLSLLLYKAGMVIGKWLSQRQFVIRRRQRRKARREAMQKPRRMSFGEFLAEIFAEPVILTIAIIVLYDHLRAIWDTSPNFATFWARIGENTRANMSVAEFVLVALCLWMVVIIIRRNRETERDKAFEQLMNANSDKLADALRTSNHEVTESLQTNSERMVQIAESIKALADEMKRDRDNERGK
jgi:hypothetical protein